MNHHFPSILLGIVIILHGAACSKHSDLHVGNSVHKPTLPLISDMPPNPDANDIFSLRRVGKKVVVALKVDFLPGKGVVIYRNSTPEADNRAIMVRIRSGVKKYIDIVPDAKAYWYWIEAIPKTGKPTIYGPLPADPNTEKTVNKIEKKALF